MKYYDLSGTWQCGIPGIKKEVKLPGTLDENGIGFPDDPHEQWKVDEVRRIGFYREGDPIVTRLTRKVKYEGQAVFSRTVAWNMPAGKRIFLDVERARHLRLMVNGREAPSVSGSVSTPYSFEVTGMTTGKDELVFLSDNSYPGWPRDAIVFSSAASDETQTNWNGLLGYIRLRAEEKVFIRQARILPREGYLDLKVELDAGEEWDGTLKIHSEAAAEEPEFRIHTGKGKTEFSFRVKTREDVKPWDLEEGNLYDLTLSAPGLEPFETRFGIRTFTAENGCLTLNGRRIFLRGETNCAAWPETGYIPMDRESWRSILSRYRAYGVNCVRFHSHCPPEAAFEAADEAGMLMQPELSHWDPVHAFSSPESRKYYGMEMKEILNRLANHPSFVMLTFGNELQADEAGHACMDKMLEEARSLDDTRLYANGSNTHYGARGTDGKSDFSAAMAWRGREMRAVCDGMTGWLNGERPNATHDYSDTMAEIRKESGQPVFSFETGQYEVLPDFGEIDTWKGVTRPDNLSHIRGKVREKGLEEIWPRMIEASGENSLQCYRAEVESALRTREYSGISLLSLQDFPGQGTALVGMMNTHLEAKPFDFARPERFAAFFRDVLPLVLLPRYAYASGERVEAPVRVANYGKRELTGEALWTLSGEGVSMRGRLSPAKAPVGSLTDLGFLSIPLEGIDRAAKLRLAVSFEGAENSYPLWVYPETEPVCPSNVYECRRWDQKAEKILAGGGRVYLAPDSTAEALPRSIQAQFSPDFWSVCTFPHQAGGMGQLIDGNHPAFRDFPTESWNEWQWGPMAAQRAMILPERVEAIITEMDSYAFLRPMAKLFECRCGGGRLMVSSLGLHQLSQYPEARALQRSIYEYMGSDLFRPGQELTPGWIRQLFAPVG